MDRLVKTMVFEELGVAKYLDSHIESTFHSIRINRYAAPNTQEEEVGSSPHHDKNFLTILQQNQVDGLQVQTKEGKWLKVSFTSPSSFAVVVGESFMVSKANCHFILYFYRRNMFLSPFGMVSV